MHLRAKMLILLALAVGGLGLMILASHWLPAQGPGLTILGLVLMAVLVLWGIHILRSSFRPLSGAVQDLGEVVSGVEATSVISHRASQSLADGAGAQAASLEQTSASLEEITSMTRANADNADQARGLMEQAQGQVTRAGQSMGEMSQAMDNIFASSQEISKIIRTIDEIAFQTNLLALNAAVEAARAGEAGAGFAVVAEEVRNLAMRAAEAAKNTQELIQNALGRVKVGVELASQTSGEFQATVEATTKCAGLVREIALASNEQRTGLEQAAQAMSQIDEVTQGNSEQAHQNAVAAQQMEGMAHELRRVAADMAHIMGTGTKRELAQALVRKALKMARHKGIDRTLRAAADPQGPLTQGKELYVFAGSTRMNTLLAHPYDPKKLVGPDLTEVMDIKGKKFFQEFTRVALGQGTGWVSYWWPKPGQQNPSQKYTFIMKVPDQPVYLACGVYA